MADLRHLGHLEEMLDHPPTAGRRAGRAVRFRLPRRLKWRDWLCFGAYVAALVLVAYLVSGLHVQNSRPWEEVHRGDQPNSTVPRALPVVDVPATPSDPHNEEKTRWTYGFIGALIGGLVLIVVLILVGYKIESRRTTPNGPTNGQRRSLPNGVAIPLRDLNPVNTPHGADDQQPETQAEPSQEGAEEPEARHSADTAIEEPPVYEA